VTAKEVAADATVPIGCGVELTRLDYQLAGTRFVEWTFGFEVFGAPAMLLDVLRATLNAIATHTALPALRSTSSFSYASSLLRLPSSVSPAHGAAPMASP
jgi:hypothetical protein